MYRIQKTKTLKTSFKVHVEMLKICECRIRKVGTGAKERLCGAGIYCIHHRHQVNRAKALVPEHVQVNNNTPARPIGKLFAKRFRIPAGCVSRKTEHQHGYKVPFYLYFIAERTVKGTVS
jgi:hypothetical protein